MDLKLKGKRALVTGSSSGLGAAIVKMLAQEGASVIVHGRNKERTNAVAGEIRKKHGGAEIALGDLSCEQGANEVIDQVLQSGPIDILINNAGSYFHYSWAEATPERWMETYQTNVVSAVRMVRAFTPKMRERGWGRVIQIGGGLAIQPSAGHPNYNASLAARHNMAVSLARELKGTGVTSNVVAPGAILVDNVRDLLVHLAPSRNWGTEWSEIERNAVAELVPNDTERLGKAEEVAGAVSYLCSSFADYISGAVIRVDGGTVRNV